MRPHYGFRGGVRGKYAKRLSGRGLMKEELFEELVESVHEGGAILKGKAAPARSIETRAKRGSREKFEAALAELPDVEPGSYDRL